MHRAVARWVAAHAPARPGHVVDVGGRDLNGTVRELFADAETYTSIDLEDGPAVDLVADFTTVTAEDLPHRPDVIVCAEVLEHAPAWREILRSAAELLADGGTLIVTAAGPGRRPHSGRTASWELAPGEYYANVDPDDLDAALAPLFADHTVDVHGTDVRAVAHRPLAGR